MPIRKEEDSVISAVYLAKKIAPHLKIIKTRFPASFRIRQAKVTGAIVLLAATLLMLEKLDCLRGFIFGGKKERENIRKRNEREAADAKWHEECEKELTEAGIVTAEEKYALEILSFVGMYLNKVVYPEETFKVNADIKIIVPGEEAVMDKNNFEKIITAAFEFGIYSAEDHFTFKGKHLQFKTFNPDLKERAAQILLTEINQKIDGGVVKLLERISVQRDADDKIVLKILQELS